MKELIEKRDLILEELLDVLYELEDLEGYEVKEDSGLIDIIQELFYNKYEVNQFSYCVELYDNDNNLRTICVKKNSEYTLNEIKHIFWTEDESDWESYGIYDSEKLGTIVDTIGVM